MQWLIRMACLIGPIALFFVKVRDDRKSIAMVIRVVVLLLGFVVYYLSEYKDIKNLYPVYAVVTWGLFCFFVANLSWKKWILQKINHFPHASREERMALLKIIPTFNLEVAKEFGKVLVSNAYDLTEAEIKELKKQSFTTDSEEHREWEKYMKDIQTAWNNYTHQE